MLGGGDVCRILSILAIGVALALGNGGVARAQACGGIYTVKPGDSLSRIADRLYRNSKMWSTIHQNNLDKIGDNPSLIKVGQKLRLACINGLPTGLPGGTDVAQATAASAPVVVAPGNAAVRLKVNLMTADDYKPFTDRSLPGGGLVTEVVEKAMAAADPPEGYAIHWVNDWSAHLEPLLSNALLDLGFPWLQPDCAADPGQYRCENFYFSDPMFEMLIMLFTNADNPLVFNADSDIVGKTLCRPKGYYTHDLDKNGRNWMREGKITLETPTSVAACFDLLMEGKVDAVALNEFTGRAAVREAGLEDSVVVAPRPLSIEGLYVIVHKSHPRAEELLALINKGLRAIKDSGEYQRIIDSHMTRIWAEL